MKPGTPLRALLPAAGIWLLVFALALAVLLACSAERPARFPHRVHLTALACGGPGQAACLSCASCHQMGGDALHALPSANQCDACHGKDPHMVRTVLAAEPERPYGTISFNHDQHLALPSLRGQCVPCHAGLVAPGAPELPPMQRCFGCHEHADEWNQGRCEPCHRASEVRRILPVTFLRHDQRFARGHGQAAVEDQRYCRACHAQADCDDCHDVSQTLAVERRRPERVDLTFVHPADFVVRHSIEAELRPASCLGCHATQTCDACHVARGVSAARSDARNPHPPGWVGNDVSMRSLHGREARRDIVACASCHDAGPLTNCIRCHKVGGYGGNPHPAGWPGGGDTSRGMCRYCHG
jgi:hypothetical protein